MTTGQDRRVAEVRRVQELRRSAAAQPVPSGKQYKRRSKHPGNGVHWDRRNRGEEN